MEKETIIEKIGRIITKIGTYLMMNLMFLVASLPIVTMGQAWCALLSAVRYQIRGDSWWDGFKFGFKTRFLRVTIVWCIMLLIDAFMFVDMTQYTMSEQILWARAIASVVMFSMMSMLTVAFLVLNVYIPTSVQNWIRNATSMVFKSPISLLVSAVAFWGPVLLAFYYPDIFKFGIMVFVVIYFTISALAITVLLKDTLIEYLIDARIEGTLIAQEGRTVDKKKDE